MNYELIISNGEKVFSPAVIDGIEWSTVRAGAAGKLSFSIVRDEAFIPSEGARVTLRADGRDIFLGYIFGRRWDKEGIISITAYDQLRYFKNRDTYVYSGKTASQVVKMLVGAYGMKTAEIADTKYVIPPRVEDNETMFDIAGNALDLTTANTGEMFILYDDFGKITLKNIADMKVGDENGYLMFDGNSAENFDFSSSIDNTFNQVKLVRENKKSGKREVFTAKSDENIGKWGVLQYYGKLTANENGRAKAESLLKLYNSKSRGLKLKNAVGDIRVRAGSMVGVSANVGGAGEFMLVESASHVFKENEHTMTLTLRGGEANG